MAAAVTRDGISSGGGDGDGVQVPSTPARRRTATAARSPRYRVWLTAASIAACCLTAGSIFCFPLFSPSLTHDLDLTLKQTSSIWVGAVLGEYGFAAPAGIIADRYGPRVLCFIAAAVFGFGYTMMGREEASALLHHAAANAPPQQQASYLRLAFAFFLCGAGVSASYFAAVTAATRTFPNFPSLAIALPLTLFSLSSMLLSAIGSSFFADPDTGDLDTSAYLFFLAYMLGGVNLLAGFAMHNFKPIAPPPSRRMSLADENGQASASGVSLANGDDADEHTPLLIPSESRPSRSTMPYLPKDSTLASFLRAPSVWALALLMFIAVGACEMVMSCIGSVVQSLLGAEPGEEEGQAVQGSAPATMALRAITGTLLAASSPTQDWRRAALAIRGKQIRLLSTMNTLSRLGAGILADLCAPTSTRVQSARRHGRTPFVLSRLSVILFALVVLFFACAYAALGFPPTTAGPTPLPAPPSTFVRLSLVSVSTGLAYGLVFTLAPSLLASAFDVAQFGRNWGLLSYACALGSLAYTMMYASISDAVADAGAQAATRTRELLQRLDAGRLSSGIASMAAKPGSAQTKAGGECLLGPRCFQPSFVVAAGTVLIAIAAVLPLWRAWRHSV